MNDAYLNSMIKYGRRNVLKGGGSRVCRIMLEIFKNFKIVEMGKREEIEEKERKSRK